MGRRGTSSGTGTTTCPAAPRTTG
ncbi:hypothetical protein ACIGQE_31145 [Streptomyces sp. NPDC053429]